MENKKEINGVLVINKPTGMNSMTCVKRVQYSLGAKKAGHLGTLDPFATGVLVVALGKGTKLFDAHLKDRKTYRAVFKFGVETDTFDSEGKVVCTEEIFVTEEMLFKALPTQVGNLAQMPPAYSAKKIKGKKAYELARQNQEVVLQPKNVTVFNFELISKLEENTFLFEIECSSGTYIRACVRDLAKEMGTVGVMVGLVRTASGKYGIEDSVTLDEIDINAMLKID